MEAITDHVASRADLAAAWPELAADALDSVDTLTLEARLQLPALGAAERRLVMEVLDQERRLIEAVNRLGASLRG